MTVQLAACPVGLGIDWLGIEVAILLPGQGLAALPAAAAAHGLPFVCAPAGTRSR